MSLKKKTIILIIAAVILLSIATLVCYYRGVDRIVRNQYGQQSEAMARAVALSVDGDMTRALRDSVMDIYKSIPEDQRVSLADPDKAAAGAYADRYRDIRKTSEFRMLETSVQKLMEQTQLYGLRLCWIDKDSGSVVYLTDASTDPDLSVSPGTFIAADEGDKASLEAPGLGLGPRMSKDGESGWLMTTAEPVYDSNFHVVGLAEISIDMNGVITEMHKGMSTMAVILIFIILLIGTVALIFVERAVVEPINLLSDASLKYYNKSSSRRIRFSDLDIHTGDEIETLARSMAMMEDDIDDYIASLTETRDQLDTTRQYAKKMDRIAYFDAMTGVRNKRAYVEALDELKEEIGHGDTDFGIAVVDLNDLKYYNDCFGHEKGDEAIRTVCRLTCAAFKQSPVFRYGGDEFAVILRGHDLEHVDEIIDRIMDEMKSLRSAEGSEPWTRISAAIGYAVYDPASDSGPDSVFKRADMAMYENKKAMKGSSDIR